MLILMSNCQFQDDVNHVNEIWRWIEKNSAAAQQGLLWFLVSFAVTRLVRKNSNTRRRRSIRRRKKKPPHDFFINQRCCFFHCRHTSCQWTNETVHFVPLILYFIYQYSCRIQAKWYKLVHRAFFSEAERRLLRHFHSLWMGKRALGFLMNIGRELA